MIAYTRRAFILDSLGKKGVISLKETAKELGVAEITVRRDFEKLESEGKLKRVQGGAASPDNPDGAELTMSSKLPQNTGEKAKAAQMAAELVQDGESVFIDGGTTMIPLADILCKRAVRIVTYNTIILQKVANPLAQIIMIGGEYMPYYNMNVGPIAQEMLGQFCFDRAFFGCAGINTQQRVVYSTEYESLNIKRIAMENAKENYLIVDSSKFSKQGFLKLCGTECFDAILSSEVPEDAEFLPNMIATTQGHSPST